MDCLLLSILVPGTKKEETCSSSHNYLLSGHFQLADIIVSFWVPGTQFLAYNINKQREPEPTIV